MKKITDYFSKTERMLWCASVFVIFISFFAFDRENYLALIASFIGVSYISVTVCFAAFLVNDLYGFISWRKMQKRQSANT